MSKKVLVDKYGNEFVKIEVKYNNKAQSIVMNDWRIGGCKWNDVDNGKFLTLLVNKKDLINELGVNKQIADIEAKLAEKEKENESLRDKLFYEQADNAKHISGIIKLQFEQVQAEKDKISFCIEQLTETKQRILQYLYNIYNGINFTDKEYLDYLFDDQIKQLKEMK